MINYCYIYLVADLLVVGGDVPILQCIKNG